MNEKHYNHFFGKFGIFGSKEELQKYMEASYSKREAIIREKINEHFYSLFQASEALGQSVSTSEVLGRLQYTKFNNQRYYLKIDIDKSKKELTHAKKK